MSDERELPPGWCWVALGQVCEFVNGRAYSQHELLSEGTPVLRIQNLNGGKNWYYSNLELEESKYCQSGDLLYAWSASFGPYIYEGPRAIFHYHIWNVHPVAACLDKKFSFYSLQSLTEEIKKAAHGVAMPHMTKAGIEVWRSPLPPLPEQRRIVAKLDELLARSRKAREALEAIPPLLEKLRQSILAAAFRGDLTAAWREKNPDVEPASDLLARTPRPGGKSTGRAASTASRPGKHAIAVGDTDATPPPGWSWAPLFLLAKMESGHTPSREHPEYWGGDFCWIGIKDAREHHGKTIQQTSQTITQEGLENSSARLLPAGTVCLSRTASVGYVTIMGKSMATSQDFANWVCGPALEPRFLAYALLAEGDDIRNFGEGTTHTTIYFPELKAFSICLAPLEEQREIIRILDARMAELDAVQRTAEVLRRQYQSLEPSLLAKAFRGELVPQDPADEPAEVMLERLRKEQEQAPVASKRGRKPKEGGTPAGKKAKGGQGTLF